MDHVNVEDIIASVSDDESVVNSESLLESLLVETGSDTESSQQFHPSLDNSLSKPQSDSVANAASDKVKSEDALHQLSEPEVEAVSLTHSHNDVPSSVENPRSSVDQRVTQPASALQSNGAVTLKSENLKSESEPLDGTESHTLLASTTAELQTVVSSESDTAHSMNSDTTKLNSINKHDTGIQHENIPIESSLRSAVENHDEQISVTLSNTLSADPANSITETSMKKKTPKFEQQYDQNQPIDQPLSQPDQSLSHTETNYFTHNQPSLAEAEQRESELCSTTSTGKVCAPLNIRRKNKSRTRRASSTLGTTVDSVEEGSQVVVVKTLDQISHQLKRAPQSRHTGHGLPTVIAVQPRFIAVGTSRSLILLFTHAQELRAVLEPKRDNKSSLKAFQQAVGGVDGNPKENVGPVTAMDVSQMNDLLVAGYANGMVILWDAVKGTSLKTVTDAHECSISSVRFWKHRSPSVLSVDTFGVANLLSFSKVFVMQVVDKQCLLDGSAGQIVSISPLLKSTNLGKDERILTTTDTGASARLPPLVALSSMIETFIVALDAEPSVLFRWPRPSKNDQSAPHDQQDVTTAVPSISWGWSKVQSMVEQPSLARGWGTCLQVLQARASTTQNKSKSPKHSAQQNNSVPGANLVFEQVATIEILEGIQALEWLSDSILLFLTNDYDLCVFDIQAQTILESTNVRSAQLVWTSFAGKSVGGNEASSRPTISFQNAFRSCAESTYLLGVDSVLVAKVQGWLERVDVLVRANRWLDALALALDHHKLVLVPAWEFSQLGQAFRGLLRENTEQGRNPKRDTEMNRIMDLLGQYVNLSIATLDSSQDQVEELRTICGASMEYCVEVDQLQMLFTDVYDCFVQYTGSDMVNGSVIYFECLEQYIVNDKVKRVQPSVLRKFVEHYKQQGNLQKVERCILHLDPTLDPNSSIQMDLDFLIRLCRSNQLYSALIYLYNSGLTDFTTPLRNLVDDMSLLDHKSAQYKKIGYKVMLYVIYCCTGRGFPRGQLPIDSLPFLRADLLSCLCEFRSTKDNSMRKAKIEASNTTNDEQLLPFSRIRVLLLVSVSDTLHMLNVAYNSPGGIFDEDSPSSNFSFFPKPGESNQWNVSNTPSYPNPEANCVAPSMRSVLHVIASIFYPDIFAPLVDLGTQATTTQFEENDRALFLDFVGNTVAAGAAMVHYELLKLVLEHILKARSEIQVSTLQHDGAHQERGQNSEAREDWMVQLLSRCNATQYDVEYIVKEATKLHWIRVVRLVLEQATKLAVESNSSGSAVKELLLRVFDATVRSSTTPVAVLEGKEHLFKFIHSLMEAATPDVLDALRDATLEKVRHLVAYERDLTSQLVIELFPREHTKVLSRLVDPELQFVYLGHIITNANASPASDEQLVSSPSQASTKAISNAVVEDANSKVVTEEVHHMYIKLLCQFDPGNVYTYLLDNDGSYSPKVVLEHTSKHQIKEATAYLLERTGNTVEALKLLLELFQDRLKTLANAVSDACSEQNAETAAAVPSNKDLPPDGPPLLTRGSSVRSATGSVLSVPLKPVWSNEYRLAQSALMVSIELCQRSDVGKTKHDSNSSKRSELWFAVLESVIDTIRLYKSSQDNKTNDASTAVMMDVLSGYLSRILDSMMAHLEMKQILLRVLDNHTDQEFGGFREPVLCMLEAYLYETSILEVTNKLMVQDVFWLVKQKHSRFMRGTRINPFGEGSKTSVVPQVGLRVDDRNVMSFNTWSFPNQDKRSSNSVQELGTDGSGRGDAAVVSRLQNSRNVHFYRTDLKTVLNDLTTGYGVEHDDREVDVLLKGTEFDVNTIYPMVEYEEFE